MDIFCLNVGKPFSKAKYDTLAIVNSTVREIFEIVGLQAAQIYINKCIRAYLLHNGSAS